MNVPQNWDLPEAILARLGTRTAGKQRAIIEDGHLLLVLHEPPGPQGSERTGVFFWRTPEGEWQYSGRGKGIGCLREHLQKYHDLEDFLEGLATVEATAADYFRLLEHLAPLRRAARNQSSALQAAREGIKGDRDLIEMRDEAAIVEQSMEILYLDAKNALEFDLSRTAAQQARLAEQTARAGHRLNILAALFFPLTALTSLFGMNLPLGFERAPVWLSVLVILAGLGLGGAMLAWVVGGTRQGSGRS